MGNVVFVKETDLVPASIRARLQTMSQNGVVVAQCIGWVTAQGFEVLRIEQDRAQPRITIRACELCKKLEGVTSHYESGIGFQRRYKQVTRMGCEVRWADREAH